jgi:eukaryotic-like serine/threonine-protein kinase
MDESAFDPHKLSPAASRGSQSLHSLAEEFVDRWRRGEEPQWTEYARQFPGLASEIERLFPTLLLLERNGLEGSRLATENLSREESPEPSLPRIKGFHILREIGRGGMGRVYEAVELALGRRVAVKVLPCHHLDEHWRSQRFEREAKVAATLHHSNIVPVFGVGEDHGTHYYVMQFIEGVSLDRFLFAFDRQRATAPNHTSLPLDNRLTVDEWSTFPNSDQASLDGCELSQGVPCQHESGRGMLNAPASLANRFNVIAQIGCQVAEALQYAHTQGVVHRDIKPSNLLMDSDGKVWITDFGLAKSEDQSSMTQTGDLLGTLRYMAPERFHGISDSRSDIYGLGMTLYELLAMRKAFDESSRESLIYQILNMPVPSLRQLNPNVPRDLVVIVHKAIEPASSRRYASAGDLAADLNRFLASEPIHARHVSSAQRVWYWAFRHPSAAALLSVIILIGLSSPFAIAYFAQFARQARSAERQAEVRLYDSLRTTAKAKRFSQQPGHHFDALSALANARDLQAELSLSSTDLDDLREDAIASLTLVDVHPEVQWPTPMFGNLSVAHFSEDLSLYCAPTADGLKVCKTADNVQLWSLSTPHTCSKVRFDPSGRLLSITDWNGTAGIVEIWNWQTGELHYRVPGWATMFAADFSPDGHWLAVGHPNGTVSIHDLEERSPVHEFAVASPPIALAFNPDGASLAVSCETAYCAEIWDYKVPRLARRLNHPSDTYGLAWSRDGRLLAVVEGNDIYLWDTFADEPEPWKVLRGHTWVVSEMIFHPDSRLLFSHSWREEKTRVWDLNTGSERLICQGFPSRVSADGRRMAYRTTDSIGVWRLAPGDICFSLNPVDNIPRQFAYCDFHPDGRWLATASDRCVDLWDTQTWQLIQSIPLNQAFSVRFDAQALGLLVASRHGLTRYPIELEGDRVVLGQSEALAFTSEASPHHLAQDQLGRLLVADEIASHSFQATGTAWVIDRLRGDRQQLSGVAGLRHTAISPDGRFVVTGTWLGEGIHVWNARSGEQLRELDAGGSASIAFSPDGAKLASASTMSVSVWKVDTWERKLVIPSPTVISCLTFAPDSRVLATIAGGAKLRLFDTQTGELITTLATNQDPTYVRWLAFSPDGGLLAMCCAADGLRIWDLEQLQNRLHEIGLDW